MLKIRYSMISKCQRLMVAVVGVVLLLMPADGQQSVNAGSQPKIDCSTSFTNSIESESSSEGGWYPNGIPVAAGGQQVFVAAKSSLVESVMPDNFMSQLLLFSSAGRVAFQSPRTKPKKDVNTPNSNKIDHLDEQDLEDINATEFNPESPISVILTVPARKPNGQIWDGLDSAAQGLLGILGVGGAGIFFSQETPPDIRLLAVTLDNEYINLGFVQNRFEAEFAVKRLPDTFALVAIDLDGVGFRGKFHDFIGAAIFTSGKKRLYNSDKQKLYETMLNLLVDIGVHDFAHPTDIYGGDQIPSKLHVVNIYDCVIRPCRLSKTDNVVVQFSNDTN